MERLNFNHLYYFYVVAQEGSIKQAAEKIHVSQPTISDQIKLLEEYFNCSLFERKNRALYLTKEGVAALDFARSIFDLSNDLTRRMRNKLDLPKSSLDIGITYHMSHYFLYDHLLPLFSQSEISIKIHENERHLLLAELDEGNIDMMFTDSRDGLSPKMESYRVGMNKTFVVAHKKFAKAKKSFPNGLDRLPFVHYTSDSFLKFEIDLFFAKYGISPIVIGEADDIDFHELVTKQGLAFTIVPELAQKRFCMDKNIVVLGELTELQTSVWGVIKNDYRGLGYNLLTKNT